MSIKINEQLLNLANEAEEVLKNQLKNIEKVSEHNSLKILNAFIDNKVVYQDFNEINGYGFFDNARDKLESVVACIFGAEDALVRPHIMSGTNAIYITLDALLRHGDTMLSISGLPYDPLQEIIGIRGSSTQSLKNKGVEYKQIELVDNDFDYEAIQNAIQNQKIKLVAIQRSCGYSHRKGLNIDKIEKVCSFIKQLDSNIIIMCDNCYGELAEEKEPTQVGVDVVCGSLMHNLGGGVATSGGYIAGKQYIIDQIADRLTSPGIGKYLGADYNQKMKIFKGLFLAPQSVANALKTATLTSYLAEKLGFSDVSPASTDKRSDIIQTFNLHSQDQLIDFCAFLQTSSPIDSFYTPTPCEMPGYPHDEIMSAGTFTLGSTIELTCDAPVVAPYKVFIQGGILYHSAKLSMLSALSALVDKYNITIKK